MHSMLQRQLKRLELGAAEPPANLDQWRAFLGRVSRAYEEADNGRLLLERSLALTSEEMRSLHQRLQVSRDEMLQRQQEALMKLSKSATLHAGDLTAALEEITEAASKTFQIERASIWIFDQSTSVLRCLDLYLRGEARHASGVELPLATYPEYFRAVGTEEIIAADDARQDVRTKEFTDAYLVPLGISSMLDVPIQHRGRMVGVVCCEHVGPPRSWTSDEQAFGRSIASVVSLAMDAEERRRLQETTVRTNAFLDSVIENLPIMVFIKDATHLRFVRWNKHAEDIIGIRREEMLAKTDYDFFPEAEASSFTAKDREVLKAGVLRDIGEEQIETRSNGRRILHTRKVPILNEKKQPEYLLGISEDITDRKQREAALLESEEKYRGLFESSRDAIMLLFPPQWMFSAGNPATIKLFGARDLEHFTSMGPWDLSPDLQPDGARSADKAPRMIERAMREGSHYFEWTHKRVDGQEFLATVTLTRITVKGQTGLQAIVRDITRQKRMEVELRAVSAFHQAMIDHAGYAIISTSPDGIIQTFNPAAEALLGYRAEEVVGKRSPALFHDTEEVALRAKLVSAELGVEISPGFEVFVAKSRRNLPSECEWTYLRKDGQRLTVSLSVTAIRGTDGSVMGFLGMASDITERKIAEQELLAAKEAAEAASVAKSQFLANMSHEIRTPMNGVLGMTELMLATKLDERQRHLAVTVQRSARALLDIINDILDFSKMEAGKLRLESINFSLRTVLQEIADLVGESAKAKGLLLSLAIQEGVPEGLRGDPIRLRQVLLNLVGNAIKFTQQGSVSIRADLLAEGETQVVVRCTVKDTGIGVIPEAHAHIFEAFAQADGSTTRQFGGTGLGLAIAKRLVSLMDGEIGVDSRPGCGAAFWFTVRLSKSIDRSEATGARLSDGALFEPMAGGDSRRVLVAEDNPVNTEVATAMLELLGCRVESVPNGRAAVDITATQRFDMILMDCQMPEMDGFEATRLIREREVATGRNAGRVPIIALTAHAMKGDREQCLAAGMDDYLTKPFTHEALRATLARWIPESPNTDEPQQARPAA